MKESRKRSFPRPRGGQDAFRGRSFGGSAVFPPQVLRQGGGSCPPAAERVARLWAPPAPSRRALRGSAGGGFPGFADSTTWDCSAPAPGTVRNPIRAGKFFLFSLYNRRAPRLRKLSFPTRARDTRKISSVYSRAPDTRILPPPTHRENSVLPPPRAAVKRFRLFKPRAPHRETPVSDPRGCRAIIFHDAIPARCPK